MMAAIIRLRATGAVRHKVAVMVARLSGNGIARLRGITIIGRKEVLRWMNRWASISSSVQVFESSTCPLICLRDRVRVLVYVLLRWLKVRGIYGIGLKPTQRNLHCALAFVLKGAYARSCAIVGLCIARSFFATVVHQLQNLDNQDQFQYDCRLIGYHTSVRFVSPDNAMSFRLPWSSRISRTATFFPARS